MKASGGLSDIDIKATIDEAQANGKLDKSRRDEIEARNQAERLIYFTKNHSKSTKVKLTLNPNEIVTAEGT
ncbi:MAG: Hsp70 family protein [Candidatus Hodgkinia cicadicola]